MNSKTYLHRSMPFILSLGLGLFLLAALLAVAGQPAARAAPTATECYATPDEGVTVFHSTDSAQALRDALAAASAGNTIWVAGVCAGAVESGGSSQVALISDTLTLRGGYTVTGSVWAYDPDLYDSVLDAQGEGRVLLLTDAGTVTLEDLYVINGQTVSIGAGVLAQDTNLSLLNTVVMSNSAGGSGGGLYVEGLFEATDSIFRNNSSSSSGGAATLRSAGLLVDSDFESNQGDGLGGALYSYDSLSITNSSFLSNTTSGWYGGALAVQGAGDDLLEVTDSFFQGNRCTYSPGCFGGALWVSNPATIAGTEFVGNSTSGVGSASGGGAVYAQASLAVQQSQFLNNTTPANGGALHVQASTTLQAVEVRENVARQNGGGIWNSGEMILQDSDVVDNRSTEFLYRGGGIYNTGVLTVSTTLLSGNQAPGGGGIFNGLGAFLYVYDNTQFLNNRVTGGQGSGGGIASDGTAAIADAVFSGNDGGSRGGGISSGGSLLVSRVTITGNVAHTGGGIGQSGGESTIEQVLFADNVSTGELSEFQRPGGGALSLSIGSSEVIDSQFSNNRAVFRGGAVYHSSLFGGSLHLVDSEVISNAAEYGGGMYLQGNAQVERNELFDNTASWGGGVVMNGRGQVELSNNFIAANSGTAGGDAIFLDSAADRAGELDLVHNTVVALEPGGTALQTDGQLAGYEIQLTNMIISGFQTGLDVRGVTDTVLVDGILWYEVPIPTTGITAVVNHSYYGPPSFVDPSAYNFHLTEESAAIDRGVPTAVDVDIDLDVRPQGAAPDLGADETPYVLAGLGDFVWRDLNRDGIQQPNEPGLAGVTVTLEDALGNVVETTTTSADGFYLFGGLAEGDYRLVFEKPGGYRFSPANQGANDEIDSDADPETGETPLITMGAETVDLSWDAGLYRFAPDLVLTKEVFPKTAAPGQLITYTLSFANEGETVAEGVMITDVLPLDALESSEWFAEGVVVTPTTGVNYSWQVEDLPVGSSGRIILAARVRTDSDQALVINAASIAANVEEDNQANNSDSVLLQVEGRALFRIYLPLILVES